MNTVAIICITIIVCGTCLIVGYIASLLCDWLARKVWHIACAIAARRRGV